MTITMASKNKTPSLIVKIYCLGFCEYLHSKNALTAESNTM